MTQGAIRFRGYDHVGIRVTDPTRALAFYAKLGFRIDPEFRSEGVAEIVAADGTRINLIFNGVARSNNVLLDEPVKWPGYTHGAFVVDSIQKVVQWAAREGIRITEGPVDWGRRLTCFLRDPDGNVLEFNELKSLRDLSFSDEAGGAERPEYRIQHARQQAVPATTDPLLRGDACAGSSKPSPRGLDPASPGLPRQ